MTTYDNTNKGIISKNDRKENDSHPDIAGYLNVEGKEYWLNGWKKTRSSDGAPFYSLSVKPKQERAAEIMRNANRQSAPDDGKFDDDLNDLPF